MIGAVDLRGDLENWCASYVDAFERYDVEAIGAHWAFPAMIISGPSQSILRDQDKFNRNTTGLMAFYKRQDVLRVVRTILSYEPLSEDIAAMRVHDVVWSTSDEQIVEWVSAYVLRRTPEGWRAIFADATGEVDAWAARGTPLGS